MLWARAQSQARREGTVPKTQPSTAIPCRTPAPSSSGLSFTQLMHVPINLVMITPQILPSALPRVTCSSELAPARLTHRVTHSAANVSENISHVQLTEQQMNILSILVDANIPVGDIAPLVDRMVAGRTQ